MLPKREDHLHQGTLGGSVTSAARLRQLATHAQLLPAPHGRPHRHTQHVADPFIRLPLSSNNAITFSSPLVWVNP